MIIIRDESPLRHLPALPRKQTLSFDGIRYSIDMAELAYARFFVNPAGKPFNAPIDHITLTAFGRSINLSTTMPQVEQMVRGLEASIEMAVEQMPDAIGHPGSDLMLIMVMDFSGRVGDDEDS